MKAVKSTLNSWQEQACEPGPQCNLKWRRGVATSSFMSTFRNGAKLKVVMTDKKPDETRGGGQLGGPPHAHSTGRQAVTSGATDRARVQKQV